MNNNLINTFRSSDERRLEDIGYDTSNYIPMGSGDVVINGRGTNRQLAIARPSGSNTRMGRTAANIASGQMESPTMTNTVADTGQYPIQSQRISGLHYHEQVSGTQEVNAQPMSFRNPAVRQTHREYYQRSSPSVNTSQHGGRVYPHDPLTEADTMGEYGSGIGASPYPDTRSPPQGFGETSEQTTHVSTGDSIPFSTTAGPTNQRSTLNPQSTEARGLTSPGQSYSYQPTTLNTRPGGSSAKGGTNAGGGRIPHDRPTPENAVGFSHVEGGSSGVAGASESTKGKQIDVAGQEQPSVSHKGSHYGKRSPAGRGRAGGETFQMTGPDTSSPEGRTYGYPQVGYSPKDDYRSTGHTYGIAGAMGAGRVYTEGAEPEQDTRSPAMRYGVVGGRGKSPISHDRVIPGADLDPNSTGHRYGLFGAGGVTSPENATTPLCSSGVRYGLAGSGGWELYDKETGQRTTVCERPTRPGERPMGAREYRQPVDTASGIRQSSPANFPSQHPASGSPLGNAPMVANPNASTGSPTAPHPHHHQFHSTSTHHHHLPTTTHEEPYFERPIGTTIDPPARVPGSQYRDNYHRDDTHPPGTTIESHPFPGDREKKRYAPRGSGSPLGESSGGSGPDHHRRHSTISRFRHRINSFFQ